MQKSPCSTFEFSILMFRYHELLPKQFVYFMALINNQTRNNSFAMDK